MSWFKKDKEDEEELKLPDLPRGFSQTSRQGEFFPGSSSNINLPEIGNVEVSSLPSLPGGDVNPNLIKDTIRYPPSQEPIKAEPMDFESSDERESFIPSRIDSSEMKKYVKRNEPIYVRLDKFETTVESFNEIKEKINEIENLLVKLKDIKRQEEIELQEWENEIASIRARIDAVDRNVFGKLD